LTSRKSKSSLGKKTITLNHEAHGRLKKMAGQRQIDLSQALVLALKHFETKDNSANNSPLTRRRETSTLETVIKNKRIRPIIHPIHKNQGSTPTRLSKSSALTPN
jgi:hypothetical protein